MEMNKGEKTERGIKGHRERGKEIKVESGK